MSNALQTENTCIFLWKLLLLQGLVVRMFSEESICRSRTILFPRNAFYSRLEDFRNRNSEWNWFYVSLWGCLPLIEMQTTSEGGGGGNLFSIRLDSSLVSVWHLHCDVFLEIEIHELIDSPVLICRKIKSV